MPEKSEMVFSYYAQTLANRRYGTLADDFFDQNFVEIKGTTIEGSHSIYIETWKSKGVVDVESTVPKSGLFYDLWVTRQDLFNGVTRSAMFNAITGRGAVGSLVWSAPQTWVQYRDNINSLYSGQLQQLSNLYTAYLLP